MEPFRQTLKTEHEMPVVQKEKWETANSDLLKINPNAHPVSSSQQNRDSFFSSSFWWCSKSCGHQAAWSCSNPGNDVPDQDVIKITNIVTCLSLEEIPGVLLGKWLCQEPQPKYNTTNTTPQTRHRKRHHKHDTANTAPQTRHRKYSTTNVTPEIWHHKHDTTNTTPQIRHHKCSSCSPRVDLWRPDALRPDHLAQGCTSWKLAFTPAVFAWI